MATTYNLGIKPALYRLIAGILMWALAIAVATLRYPYVQKVAVALWIGGFVVILLGGVETLSLNPGKGELTRIRKRGRSFKKEITRFADIKTFSLETKPARILRWRRRARLLMTLASGETQTLTYFHAESGLPDVTALNRLIG